MNQTQIKRNEIFEKIKNIKNHVKNITKKRRENIINNYNVKNEESPPKQKIQNTKKEF